MCVGETINGASLFFFCLWNAGTKYLRARGAGGAGVSVREQEGAIGKKCVTCLCERVCACVCVCLDGRTKDATDDFFLDQNRKEKKEKKKKKKIVEARGSF
jgi:hypothetical protein